MRNVRVFKSSRKKAVLLLLGSICFVAGGYAMSHEKPLIGWLCVFFFSLGIPASLLMLMPNAVFLRLDEEGFEFGSFRRRQRILWREVAGFELGAIRGAKMIAIRYSPEYQKQQLGRAVAGALSGMEGAIANSYDAPLTEVLDALNAWKSRFGTSGI